MALAGDALAAPQTGGGFTGHELAGRAHINLSQARAIAQKARPGAITDQELEKEGGGSGLRYSFDISRSGRTYEVGVDAMTGKVLENGHEGAAAEAAEATTEHNGAH
ncbi:MAG TPA: PepSY domain-containing protein [Caulobacteraceae bacterium]|nr:PepSY domain-containing protein [Caulobacteraceae bacterium]